MILTIGGIEYPCAPFNGFYMCTEIASRNLGDERRYNVLPAVARALGHDPSKAADTLWQDRALTELNAAVIHSFKNAGVTLVDHHTASEQYMVFQRRERSAGRIPSGRWSWIVPPQASSSCPVFHVDMTDAKATPNFYRSRAIDGNKLAPDYSDENQPRIRSQVNSFSKRVYAWRRACAVR
jgi:nitric-oxide synthase